MRYLYEFFKCKKRNKVRKKLKRKDNLCSKKLKNRFIPVTDLMAI